MIKKVFRTLILSCVIVLGFFSSNTFATAPNMDGWNWIGKPIYLQGNTKFTNASDISGSNIMSRLRSSYTYNNRRTKVLNVDWMQEKMYAVNNGVNYYYANITYDMLPDGRGNGYTEWYDSPQGIFLDYVTQFILGKVTDTSHGNPSPITDSIYYNRIQYPGTQQTAFVGSTQVSGDLSDSKSAAILNRRGKTDYPIYLNDGKDLDEVVKKELNSKNVRNIWILGGSERFNSTAGLGANFNIIRVGGINRNETLEFMKTSPEKLKLPSKFSADSNGIVVKGNLGWLQSSVYDKLVSARNNRNVNSIIAAANDIFNNMTVGNRPYPEQEPALVIGVNYQGWESYVSIYYSQLGGAYVYQFVLPGYFDVYEPINNWVDISGADYINGNDYWIKPNKNFSIYTESRMKNAPYGLYPTNTEAVLESWSNGYSYSSHGMYPWDNGIYSTGNFNNEFNAALGEKAAKWQRTDSGTLNNYISGTHVMSAKYDNRDYKVSSSGYYVDFNSWIGSTPYHNGKWVKTDGTAPSISKSYTSSWTNNDVTITSSISDSRSGVKSVNLYNSANSSVANGMTSLSYIVKSEGISKFTIKALDNVKNESTENVEVKIDKTKPSGVFTPDSKIWTKDNITVSFNPSDNLSGVKQWRYAISNNNGS
ncbi:MAG: hypothetical protein E7E64_05325, partial [Clostridium celatum]|nr:hypothetical protein [Clostridium celatum]